MLYNNVTVEEIKQICEDICNKEIEQLEDFEDATEESEKEWQTYRKVLDTGDLNNVIDDILLVQNSVLEQISNRGLKDQNFIEKIKLDIEQCNTLYSNLSSTITENEKKIKQMESKIININKKKENLLNMRDKIQVFKLLTNTSFAYKGDTVHGFVLGPISRKIYPFEMNPKNQSNKEISENLYQVLKNVSLES